MESSDDEREVDVEAIKSEFKDAAADVDLDEVDLSAEPQGSAGGSELDMYKTNYGKVRDYALKLRGIIEANKHTVALACKAAVDARLRMVAADQLKEELTQARYDLKNMRKRVMDQMDEIDAVRKEKDEYKLKYEQELEVELELEEKQEEMENMRKQYETLLKTERERLDEVKNLLLGKDIPGIVNDDDVDKVSTAEVAEMKEKHAEERAEILSEVDRLKAEVQELRERQEQQNNRARTRRASAIELITKAEENLKSPVIVITEDDAGEAAAAAEDAADKDVEDSEARDTVDLDDDMVVETMGSGGLLGLPAAGFIGRRLTRQDPAAAAAAELAALTRERQISAATGSNLRVDFRQRLRAARDQLRQNQAYTQTKRLMDSRVRATRLELRYVRETLTSEVKKLSAMLTVTQAELARLQGDLKKRQELVKDANKVLGKLRSWVGIEVPRDETTENKEIEYVEVVAVKPGSPAEASGLLRRDRIEAVDGEDVHTVAELRKMVQLAMPGDSVSIQVNRNDNIELLTVHVGAKGYAFEHIVELRRIAGGITKKGDEAMVANIKRLSSSLRTKKK